MAEKLYTRGRFVWIDCMSLEPEKSQAFYGELFNWKVQEMDMGPMGTYRMLMAGETGVGGIMPLDPKHRAPSHWINYITVEDVDATVAKVKKLGGKELVSAMDFGNVGRGAVVADPQGAVFAPFKAGSDGEVPEKDPGIGEFCWHEVMVDDVAKAKTFYGDVFGWTFEKMPQPEGEYWMAKRGDKMACGLMKKPANVPAPPHWLSYVLVEDLDHSQKRATKLGAKALMGPQEVPNIGTFTVIQDPVGAVLCLFEGVEKP